MASSSPFMAWRTIRDDVIESLTMSLLASFAEFERALIIERIQSGRKRAMANVKISSSAKNAIKRRYGGEVGTALAKEYGIGSRTVQRAVVEG